MAKFAICLYGRFGNRFDSEAGELGLQYLIKQVIGTAEADFFLFSYDTRNEKKIRNILGNKLTDSHFCFAPSEEELWNSQGGNTKFFHLSDSTRSIEGTFRFFSQRDGSIKLMLQHSKKHNITYDGVMISRMDLGQIDKFNQRFPQRVSEAPCLISFQMPLNSVFHAAWNQLNEGLPDQWFFCSPKDAEIIVGASDRVKRYLLPGSDYLTKFIRAIPHSNPKNLFSNEVHAMEKSKKLSNRNASKALDNHLLHKYDFMQVGLYDRLAPAFDSKGLVHLTYTHSSYLDAWHMSHKAQQRHLGEFIIEYLAIEKTYSGARIPNYYKVLGYSETESYTKRLLSVLGQVKEEFVLFTHEDMPLIKTPVTNSFFEAMELLKSHPQNAVVRLTRVGPGLNVNLERPSRLPYFIPVMPWSRWKFSVQPSIWKRKHLLELLRNVPSGSVWDFEVRGQAAFNALKLRSFQPISAGKRRGKHHWDSLLYPYIATAVVKGRWNVMEYPELECLIQAQDAEMFSPRQSLPYPEDPGNVMS
jgi:hypothetical protein